MQTITISKKITKGKDLVIIPREDYERLIAARTISEFEPSVKDKRALAKARHNRARGNFLTLDELKQKAEVDPIAILISGARPQIACATRREQELR